MRKLFFPLVFLACLAPLTLAQETDLSTSPWFSAHTAHFDLYGRVSAEQTGRRAMALEQWRAAALDVLGLIAEPAAAPVKTQVYLFEDDGEYALFADNNDPAYFYSSPRTNFIILKDTDAGMRLAQHHYAHFLINNNPVGMPRWYEEGMSHYLSRLEAGQQALELRALSVDEVAVALALNDELDMDELLYDDAALASPRQIQIANLKAAFLVHFLLHGHEVEGFADRREVLRDYLGLLQQGRTERFAFDQSFNLSVRRLAQEFERYLQALSSVSLATTPMEPVPQGKVVQVNAMENYQVSVALAELALHSGRFPMSAYLFEKLQGVEAAGGRAYSGYADAMRMRDTDEFLPADTTPTSVDFEALYAKAVALFPEDYQLHLDFGQYYDATLEDCDRPLLPEERARMVAAMDQHFTQALALNSAPAEVNLSYAQIFLQEGKSWEEGVPYQQKAFSLLPSDGFVIEQQIDYAIAQGDFELAESLIARMARPMHFLGDAPWIAQLREKLRAARRGRSLDPCAPVN